MKENISNLYLNFKKKKKHSIKEINLFNQQIILFYKLIYHSKNKKYIWERLENMEKENLPFAKKHLRYLFQVKDFTGFCKFLDSYYSCMNYKEMIDILREFKIDMIKRNNSYLPIDLRRSKKTFLQKIDRKRDIIYLFYKRKISQERISEAIIESKFHLILKMERWRGRKVQI